ncbi:NAD(P)/FAD-dependent oxidoreductase [Marinitenerispora sediminis]|uniref:FAD-dependent oxidoreductase n=1 Tax=Marinitenerispora sediminis TaxID=1931232 RepID=A0A368TAW1_9ACTN|nr:FAD-dependent oxidoreductase [Marinitenerispora sediminis]RCV53988.1 FAD-dependent oxidoreductase [Marinitenerispora sediminis]RCV60461.1 FAD-dependent oxidoreductase [Marinitenerispora sediminis]RCV61859.1 FAD-dependent oxidoreductase [Marinitenerispora sediminis]
MTAFDFAIVGGGIVGACLAEETARLGGRTVVLDAGERPGHATRYAAGVAVPSLRYATDPEFHAWLWQGRALLDADIGRLEPAHGTFAARLPLLRALRPGDAETLGPLLADDPHLSWVDHDEVRATAPAMRLPADRRYLLDERGLMVDGAGYLGAVRAAGAALGVEWRQGATVLEVAPGPDRVRVVTADGQVSADRVVIAAGAWSGTAALARGVPVRPQRGELLRLSGTAALPWILSSAHYLAPGPAGEVIVGATEDDASGFTPTPTAAGTTRLLRYALAVAPELASAAPTSISAALRPVTDTGRPLVGRVPGEERVFLAAGHAGHGLLSARATAAGLAAALDRGEWESLPFSFCPTENARRRAEAAL